MTTIVLTIVLPACISAAMFALLWKLTVNEAFGLKFAILAGHRSVGDEHLDAGDVIDRITSAQGLLLMTGMISAIVSLLALINTVIAACNG